MLTPSPICKGYYIKFDHCNCKSRSTNNLKSQCSVMQAEISRSAHKCAKKLSFAWFL